MYSLQRLVCNSCEKKCKSVFIDVEQTLWSKKGVFCARILKRGTLTLSPVSQLGDAEPKKC